MLIKTLLFTIFCQVLVAGQFKTAVLILARGGSKGVRLKNLRDMGGMTLLARSILTARQAGYKDITVSTDHALIALEAIKYNASIFKRSHATSSDWAPSIWGVSEFIETRPDIDILILLQATSPFINFRHLEYSVKKLISPIPFDCIFSVTRSYKLRWKYNNSGIYPVNFNFKSRPRRQGWAGEFIETGAFYISRKELLQKGYLQNHNCTVWEVSQAESLEVDSEFDLLLANIFLVSK